MGDTIGCEIDLELGCISYFKNGRNLGVCFQEGMRGFGKAKIYPLLQLYKCKISNFMGNVQHDNTYNPGPSQQELLMQ